MKNETQLSVFNLFRDVSIPDETLFRLFDIAPQIIKYSQEKTWYKIAKIGAN